MKLVLLPILATLAVLPARASAHAMAEASWPSAGAVLMQAPAQVEVRFDADLESLFSTLLVETPTGHLVSTGKGTVDTDHPRIMRTRTPHLAPGAYQVLWTAVSRDGHRTHGQYTFVVHP